MSDLRTIEAGNCHACKQITGDSAVEEVSLAAVFGLIVGVS